MLVRAVGQKHNKVARLRMAPDPVMDPEREKMEMMKQMAKNKTRRVREDDGLGGARKRKYAQSRRRTSDPVWSDEEPGEGVFNDSEDDDDGQFDSPKKTRASASEKKGEYQTDGFVVADPSDEDDDDVDSSSRKRRKHTEDESGAADDLDEIDARIARQERDKKRDRHAKTEDAPVDEKEDAFVEMDVESEDEDEEDFKVRRAGAGSRRKRAVAMDDDDEE